MTPAAGQRLGADDVVHLEGNPLCPRLDLHPHSPAGFAWGDRTAGATQLALAILADHLPADENRVLRLYLRFRDEVIANLRDDSWTLTSEDIDEWLSRVETALARTE